MSLLGPWLLLPLLLAALCLGTGLLVERLGGRPLPTPLLVPLGFCGLVAAMMLTTATGPTAPLSRWVALLLGVAGLVLGRRRLLAVPRDPALILAPVVVFGVVAASAVLTGQRTFLGYTSLGDASFNFALVDHVLHEGRSLAGLDQSSYRQVLQNYLDTAYPLGGHVVLGAVTGLTGIDVSWTYQPFLAMLPALAAPALVPLVREVTTRRAFVAGVPVVVGVSAMVFAYAVFQQAIKELSTVVVLVTLVALVPPLVRERPGWRVALPLAVVSAAGLGVLNLALAPWLGPTLLAALAALVWRNRHVRKGPLVAEVAGFAVLGLVLAVPVLRLVTTFVQVTNGSLTGARELGNLQDSIPFGNAFGVWPVDDFRLGLSPTAWGAIALVGVAVVLAVAGLSHVVRRRAWGVALFVAVSLIGFAVVAGRASPWAYGKALMVLSPALVLLAGLGVAAVFEWRRTEAVVLGAALVLGVLWTDAINYHKVDPAPHDRLAELEHIGERFAGQGPAVTFEFEEYGKHYLRRLAPNSLTEAVNNGDVQLGENRTVQFGVSSEPDDWFPTDLRRYRLLVVRRGPTASRPPSAFRRVWRGTYYSVWRRLDDAPEIVRHFPLGSRYDAAGPVACADAENLATEAVAAGGRLAYAPRPPATAFRVAEQQPPPPNWGVDGTDPAVLRPIGQGRVSGVVDLPRGGTMHLWAEGSLGRRETITVDGRPVGAAGPELSPRRGAVQAGTVRLRAGRHRVSLLVGGGDLRPGNGAANRLVGPIYLTPAADVDDVPVRTLAPSQARRLCGRSVDWIEVVR